MSEENKILWMCCFSTGLRSNDLWQILWTIKKKFKILLSMTTDTAVDFYSCCMVWLSPTLRDGMLSIKVKTNALFATFSLNLYLKWLISCNMMLVRSTNSTVTLHRLTLFIIAHIRMLRRLFQVKRIYIDADLWLIMDCTGFIYSVQFYCAHFKTLATLCSPIHYPDCPNCREQVPWYISIVYTPHICLPIRNVLNVVKKRSFKFRKTVIK